LKYVNIGHMYASEIVKPPSSIILAL
jgi:hypothetical protein